MNCMDMYFCAYLTNDVDAARASRNKIGLLSIKVLELGQQALPSLGLYWKRVLGVNVA